MKIKLKFLGLVALLFAFGISLSSCTKDDLAEEQLYIENNNLELESSTGSDRSSMRSANSAAS